MIEKIDNFLVIINTTIHIKGILGTVINDTCIEANNSLHILNYNKKEISETFINNQIYNIAKEKNANENDLKNKIILIENLSKDFNSINDYCKKLTDKDFLIILGGERLIPFKENELLIDTKYSDVRLQFHSLDKENWEGLASKVDELFVFYQNKLNGIIFVLDVYENCVDVIKKSFDMFNSMSVCSFTLTGDKNDEYIKMQEYLITQINENNLSDFLNILKEYKNKLKESHYNYLKSVAYIKNGDRENATNLLEKEIDNFGNKEKLMLADLYTSLGREKESYNLLKYVYNNDKYEPGLFPAIFRCIENLETENIDVDWIKEALDVDNNNPAVLESVANYYNRKNRYNEASVIRRKIFSLCNDPLHELIARILDLFDNPPDDKNAESYIDQLIIKYPELKNESNYRLGRYFTDFRKSYYSGYCRLRNVDLDIKKDKAYEISLTKLELLKDIEKASKVLRNIKPFEKKEDSDKLEKERITLLLESIPILAFNDNGFHEWKDFIEKTYPEKEWKKIIFKELLLKFEKYNIINFDDLLPMSFFNKKENDIQEESLSLKDAILFLKHIKSGDVNKSQKELEDAIIGTLKLTELKRTQEEKYWIRYYSSLCYSVFGKHQEANNHALTILQLANKEITDISEIRKYIMLGLMAWGNSQYRIGNQIEGILCTLCAIELCIEINEVYPLFEEGKNILFRFIMDNKEIFENINQDIVINFFDKVKTNNEYELISILMMSEKWDKIYDLLSRYFEANNENNTEWVINLNHLIQACMKLNKKEEACKFIIKYKDIAISILEKRLDVRYKVLQFWAEILFFNIKNNIFDNYKIVTELLEIAIVDVEKRRAVYHKSERAAIGDSATDLYKFYLYIQILFFNLKDITEEERKNIRIKIEQTFLNLLPRSINEQKEYHKNKKITNELYNIENEYKQLYDEIRIMGQLGNNQSESYQEKAKKINDLLAILVKDHPYYSPLQKYNSIDFDRIKINLIEGELFYHFINTKFGIIFVIISKEYEEINFFSTKSDIKIDDYVNCLGYSLQEDKLNTTEIIKICDLLSQAFYFPVLKYIEEKKEIKKLYVISDFKLSFFSINLLRTNDKWLVQNIDSLINLIDYNVLIKKEEIIDYENKVIIKLLGNPNDNAMKKIKHLIKNFGNNDINVIIKDDFNNDVSDITEICSLKKARAIIIIGHGVPDPNSDIIRGAMSIEGNNEIISIDEIADLGKYAENLLIISCSGGVPFEGQVETNTGIWGSILEKPLSNIVMCKWDVPVIETIKMIKIIINNLKENEWDLSKSLVIAQKELMQDGINPSKWAGLEYWKNY